MADTTTHTAQTAEVTAQKDRSQEVNSNILSKLFFAWAQPLFTRASNLHKENKALEEADLLLLPLMDHGESIAPTFEKAWKDAGSNNATLSQTLRKVIGRRLFHAGVIKLFNSGLQFTFPLLLNAILKFVEETQAGTFSRDDPWYVYYRGYWLSALLFLAMASKAITENYYFQAVYRAGFQSRVAISVAVYNKSLRLASSERHGTTLGELTNLMQVDASKVEAFVPQIHTLWDGMLQIIGYMVILYTLIGWPCFAGLVMMILAGPIQGVIMKRLFGLNRSVVQFTDNRVKTTNEAVQGIRCVKMYTWENSIGKVIENARDGELTLLKRMAYLRGFSRAYMSALPGVVAMTSFVVFSLTGGIASASTLFAALAAFGQLRFPLLFYPMALAQYAQASVSASRIEGFLRMEEVGTGEPVDGDGVTDSSEANPKTKIGIYNGKMKESLQVGQVTVKNVTIYWRNPDIPIPVGDDSNSTLDQSMHSQNSKKSDNQKKDSSTEKDEIESNAELRYPQPILSFLDLDVSPGELCAVVGRVGSGKTTLCSAILNETVLRDGEIALKGTVAYAAQSAWILNATVRDNITFGMPFNREKYDSIIKACQLAHDLEMLDAGDMTEIGENGINLSGGQKQRVSIARAAYSNADIIILDDPLSALDPEVGKLLFEECIMTLMNSKTRIFVTNQLQCLHFCDKIVGLGEGKILERGTFEEISQNNGEVQRLLNDLKASENEGASSNDNKSNKATNSETSVGRKKERKSIVKSDDSKKIDEKEGDDHLLTEEERNVGAVSWTVYKKYLGAGGGLYSFMGCFSLYILCSANELWYNAWVAYWTSDTSYIRHPEAFYLGIYGLTSVTLGIFTFFRSMFLARFGVRASKKLHDNVLDSILRSPMSFFDTTPTGRILSRFSKDLYAIDLELSEYLDFVLLCSLSVVISLGAIVFATPWFGIAIVPLIFIYFRTLNYFREVARETKRLESISRSPVFAHFSETLGGLSTIRSYNQAGRFISDFELKVDENTRATYNNKSADRWLSVRLELLGSSIAGLAAAFATHVVISGAASASPSSDNFASLAGLSLTYAISVTGLLNWVVRCFAQLEAAMNATERVLFYTEHIPHEAPRTTGELEIIATSTDQSNYPSSDTFSPSELAVRSNGIENPDSSWPSDGTIVFKNLKMRYRPETPLVIKGLDVKISGGSRVGVVGRTGSGKSSLLLTLLRIVEPDLSNIDGYEAPIVVDGVDILRVGLNELRSKIGIIPQNPVLFSGTIRSNLDPFDEHSDEEIWNSLEGCGMKVAVEGMSDLLLQSPVAEYGENLSQGQRQLLCLGRALLKKCQILLLDEATSSVDYETDKAIQRTLREAFIGCTVLTIAHRVNTIMDSDNILVMVNGKVGEYGPPQELLSIKDSIFSEIVQHSQTESDN